MMSLSLHKPIVAAHRSNKINILILFPQRLLSNCGNDLSKYTGNTAAVEMAVLNLALFPQLLL